MNRVRVSIFAFAVFLASSPPARAGSESQENPRQGDFQEKQSSETIFAASTRWGDTGFFDVFSAYTIRKHKVAAQGFRDEIDRDVFNMDISNLGATFTFGITDRIELFGRFDLQRQTEISRSRSETPLSGAWAPDFRATASCEEQ